MSPAPQITLLNGMLGRDFAASLARHRKFDLRLLDLKDSIFGKNFSALTTDEAISARALIDAEQLEVYTLSSSLCHLDIELGESVFRSAVENEMKQVLQVAAILRPTSIRLLSAWSSSRSEFIDSTRHIENRHPWLFTVYRECIDRLAASGYTVFIENEADRNILSSVSEIRSFFEKIDRPEKARLTWDIQNLWQMGTFPSIGIYEQLRDLTGYLHFKGGRANDAGKLAWASSLEKASWPVAEIVRRAVADQAIPVFCLNPSHGQYEPGFDLDVVTERDLLFMQQLLRKG